MSKTMLTSDKGSFQGRFHYVVISLYTHVMDLLTSHNRTKHSALEVEQCPDPFITTRGVRQFSVTPHALFCWTCTPVC